MKRDNIQGSLILLVTATIWGFAFAFQSAGMDYMGPFRFMVLRNIIGTIVLLPIAVLNKGKSESTKTLIRGGVICGIALGTAGCLQQYGLVFTTAGKAGFITALYIIMIPIAGAFMKQKCPKNVYPAVVLAIIGLYFLCINGEFTISRGDFFEFLCAMVFTVQILSVAHFSSRVNVYKLACIEFVTAGLVALIPAVLTETFSFSVLGGGALVSVLYTGILSSGAGYTLQIIGQRKLNPTVAAIIMSLESCVSVIGGWLILGQSLTAREITGCIIMFAAIILAQLPEEFICKILRRAVIHD